MKKCFFRYLIAKRKRIVLYFFIAIILGYLNKYQLLVLYSAGTPLKIHSHFLVVIFGMLGALFGGALEYGQYLKKFSEEEKRIHNLDD